MTIFIIDKIGKNENPKDYGWNGCDVRNEFFPESDSVSELDEEWETFEIKGFLKTLEDCGCKIDYKKQSFILPDEKTADNIRNAWIDTEKLGKELDSCDKTPQGFVNLLCTLKEEIEFSDSAPVIIGDSGYSTIVFALDHIEKNVRYTVCQALEMYM